MVALEQSLSASDTRKGARKLPSLAASTYPCAICLAHTSRRSYGGDLMEAAEGKGVSMCPWEAAHGAEGIRESG